MLSCTSCAWRFRRPLWLRSAGAAETGQGNAAGRGPGVPDVALHLKGSAGSFRPVDDKPGLTLILSRGESGGRFHGLRKFHLNNSVQDPTYLSEAVSGGLFRAAGVPAARAAHAVVELNGRKLGFLRHYGGDGPGLSLPLF